MYKKIVWSTDGSEEADLGLEHAKALAAEAGGEVLVVHCEEYIPPGSHLPAYPVIPDEDEVKAKIERQASELAAAGIKTAMRMVTARAGGAAHAIADLAQDEHADVIVVGTRGRTPLAGLLLGSVTQRLLHIAPCPVLAVPAIAGHSPN